MKRTNKLFQSILAGALLATISIPMRGMGPKSLKEFDAIVQDELKDCAGWQVDEKKEEVLANAFSKLKEEIKQGSWVHLKTLAIETQSGRVPQCTQDSFIQCSPDGRYLLIGTSNVDDEGNNQFPVIMLQNCITWDDNQVKLPIDEYYHASVSANFADNGRLLSVVDHDNTLYTWDTHSWTQIKGFLDSAHLSKLSPNGRCLAFIFHDEADPDWHHSICIFSNWRNSPDRYDLDAIVKTETGNEIIDREHVLYPMTFSSDSRYLAYITTDNTVALHNLETPEDADITIDYQDFVPHHVEFSPDGTCLLIGSVQPKNYEEMETKLVFNVWNIENQQTVATLGSDGCAMKPTFSPDGKYFCVSNPYKHALEIYDTQTWQVHKTIETSVAAMTFVGNDCVAVAIKDKINIYNIHSGQINAQIDLDVDVDVDHAFLVASPDGSWLAHRYRNDKDVYIWTKANFDAKVCSTIVKNIISKLEQKAGVALQHGQETISQDVENAKQELAALMDSNTWKQASAAVQHSLKRGLKELDSEELWSNKKQKTDNN